MIADAIERQIVKTETTLDDNPALAQAKASAAGREEWAKAYETATDSTWMKEGMDMKQDLTHTHHAAEIQSLHGLEIVSCLGSKAALML